MENPFETIDQRLMKIEEALIRLASLIQPSQREKRYYSVSEAAKKLNVAEITLYRNVNIGKIPAKKVGARLMIPCSYVDGPSA
jgi:excisionase family DNA binding protein